MDNTEPKCFTPTVVFVRKLSKSYLQPVVVNSSLPEGAESGSALIIIELVDGFTCATYWPLVKPLPTIYIPTSIPDVLVTTIVVPELPVGL